MSRYTGAGSSGVDTSSRFTLAARRDRCATVFADYHFYTAIQLSSARVGIIRDWKALSIALGSDARRIYAPRDQRELDGVGTSLREILVIRVRADTVGISVDLHTPL